MTIRTLLSRLLSATPLALLPVRVRKGPARGARWTLLPFSFNWREGGEGDLVPGLALVQPLRGAVCWDFGAHFGIHAIGMAMQVGPTGQVAAFEPDPVAFTRLERHIRINRLVNIRAYSAAVSEATGSVQLISSCGLGSTFSHMRYPDEPEPDPREVIAVNSVAPDELVRKGEILLPHLIKVDVQGHGANAIAGSIRSIRASSPVILFSHHTGNCPPELTNSPWIFGGSSGTDLSVVLDKLYPEFLHLFLQFHI